MVIGGIVLVTMETATALEGMAATKPTATLLY